VKTIDARALAEQTYAQALGRAHRDDPVRPGSGGPAGNARLTAWTGVVLLALFAAALVTLLDVRGLIGWHVAVGVLLVPPALVKTGSTGWRIVRYYTGDRSYRRAGPPPWPLRVLGPLVVVSTLAVLASGLLLVFIGAPASRTALVTVLGHSVDATTLHKAAFAAWVVVTGLHVLGRLVPAAQLTGLIRLADRVGLGRFTQRAGLVAPPAGAARVPGRGRRTAVVAGSLIAAAVAAVLVLGYLDLSAWSAAHRPPGTRPGVTGQRAK